MPRCHNPFNTYATTTSTTTTNTTAKITNNKKRRRRSRRCDAIFKKIYATTERGEQIKKRFIRIMRISCKLLKRDNNNKKNRENLN